MPAASSKSWRWQLQSFVQPNILQDIWFLQIERLKCLVFILNKRHKQTVNSSDKIKVIYISDIMTQWCHFEQSYVGTAVNNAAPASTAWDAQWSAAHDGSRWDCRTEGPWRILGNAGMFELAYSLYSPRLTHKVKHALLTSRLETRPFKAPTPRCHVLKYLPCCGSSPRSSTVSGSEL